jgi:3-deoxy-D-manno-octulosonate 8-phosphate phosphatase (KDO 8-P phosphatase)
MKKISMLVMDIDGTLTDGKIYINNENELFKVYNVKDGQGVKSIINAGIKVIFITGRNSSINLKRAQEIGVKDVYQNCDDKLTLLDTIIRDNGLDYNTVAYIGDDLNDLDCIKAVKYSGCPIDANKAVKKHSYFISKKKGGDGAVRDFIDFLLK